MEKRLLLHEDLCRILGNRNVYFQPPESVKLNYPCIIYSFAGSDSDYADNRIYSFTNQYDILLITRDTENTKTKELAMAFPMIRHSRHYVADNLQHDSYTLYF